ncbi:MAG: 4'-phosphopantetheinyl transferase family protein, partial [Bosea sp. (in: a-proteobacteria)]
MTLCTTLRHHQLMIWLDSLTKADSLPAAWLIVTGEAPRTRPERSALRHATTRNVLSMQLGVFPDEIELANDIKGRLMALGPDNQLLHVSHATRDGMVLVAMGRARIGADIERVGSGAIPFAALHRAEQLWLHQLPDEQRELAFAELWAVKEAHGKWAGTGLLNAEIHPALPASDGTWQIAGSIDVALATKMVTLAAQRSALGITDDSQRYARETTDDSQRYARET